MKTILRQVLDNYASQHGMTHADIAKALHMNKGTYTNKINGKRALTLEDGHRIARLLDTSMDALYLMV